jgi:hypothetical protein
MPIVIKNKIFISSVILFLLHQFLQKGLNNNIPIIHEYLDDLLCMPVVLTLTLFAFRKFVVKNEMFSFSLGQVVWAVIYFSIIFEIALPYFSSQYTSDPVDVIAYSIGAFVFYKKINPSKTIVECEN